MVTALVLLWTKISSWLVILTGWRNLDKYKPPYRATGELALPLITNSATVVWPSPAAMVNRRLRKGLKERAVALSAIGYDAPTVADILGASGDSVKRRVHNLNVTTYGAVQRESSLCGRKQILSTRIIEDIHDLLRSSPALYLNWIACWIAVTYG
ncbi:hypothetical protein ONZ51_g6369 [Trametes cubensis]|uniref:Uncharacterized protein n=1 Tax=Trametes cubensis TaxID=1111947 RepID=A0AAD7TUV6_9APHY|nr:hypothetical protein ONZ51_g6369 [Trametes cubensis]